MLATAATVPDLRVIPGSTDVIVDISRQSLRVASLIHEYTNLSFAGHSLLFPVKFQVSNCVTILFTERTIKIISGDLKSRIETCQKGCASLKDRFSIGVHVDTNIQVKEMNVNMGTFLLVCLFICFL